MGKSFTKSNTFKKKDDSKKSGTKISNPFKDRRFQLTSGFFLLGLSIFLFVAFLSYLFTWKEDQSIVETYFHNSIIDSALEIENWLGLYGAVSAHYFMFKWFGIASFFIPPLLLLYSIRILNKNVSFSSYRITLFSLFSIFWLSLLFGSIIQYAEGIAENASYLSGGFGYQLSLFFNSLIGWGTFIFLIFSLLVFIIYYFNITTLWLKKKETGIPVSEDDTIPPASDPEHSYVDESDQWTVNNDLFQDSEEDPEQELFEESIEEKSDHPEVLFEINESVKTPKKEKEDTEPEFTVEVSRKAEKIVESQGQYDPTLDLESYQYPTLELLKEYKTNDVQVSKEELENNKDKIIETLVNFKIGITSIKATIGPTVTLYEIVPDAGIKISKIKNLEDDIALSLAALGIRIIAPIPGKGTIGIEVPNKNRELVSVRSTLATEAFMKSDKELPVILGKTIANEVYVVDLTKMPHLLIAGATGQGKSVGINVLLASLLYRKHPSQLKLILVDPKKVELSLFSKIERHFLAMLPDSEEAIITDTKKVVYTLNSLCIEMDNRYNLLKDGGARNLKEYNAKFIKRQLNPENGHKYLPYIVLVIDELADLMMTAGKEVEAPIARLAQLARAIGIHLVVATQRPSVNVITGVIKANFPARLSFRVTSKVDSRTILDTGGADQLIGMGDMLLSQGSDLIRLQCPFIDTPEVEELCEFIGAQRGYESAYMLPEFIGDEDSSAKDVDLSDRDALFDEAARLVVIHQQGSTSLIQRKLKLGYNRAGRLIDQLEAAGIVGAFEGSKAREVLIQDEYSLEQLLKDLE
ncbi:MAG: DNA translocase FtsK [Cyclobacteriaceae bacterium]|nr:DNA translocase FtsK [Cyclobacteriaceae bacterium]